MKGIIDEKTQDKLWGIVKKEMGDFYNDPGHGIRHIRAVHDNFILFLKSKPKISKDILESLEWAAILHDLGRAKTNSKIHGKVSAEIIKKSLRRDKSLRLENPELMLYIVRWHSDCDKVFKYCDKEPEKEKDKWQSLAIFVFLDHMDALGVHGIERSLGYLGKKPLLPKEGPNLELKEEAKLKEWLADPERRRLEESRRAKSLLEQLLIDKYYWVDRNLERAKYMIPESFQKEFLKRAQETKEYILKLVRENK